ASGEAILRTGGTQSKRYALPNSSIMLHQPWGQIGGQASDVEIGMKEMLRMKEILNNIIAFHTKKPVEVIAAETERDHYFTAEEAKAFGLIDEVLEKPKDVPKGP